MQTVGSFKEERGKALKKNKAKYYRETRQSFIVCRQRLINKKNRGRLGKKSGQDFLSSRAGFPPRAGLIFLARKADFPNFSVTLAPKSVTVFSASCCYFLSQV
jgi:hypothetical protein